ncbi:hypothetical protein GQ607_009308 [Colletotrichum asianum]|uniref:Uncharacterized protein n=1 Tax=Colletotrichum asianum TaxID=702518 RepID=A0A8H3ZRD6_9PEZI|nr:hypothetical protein GQ607_009308 [Colletotrichum asianum]
MWLVASVCHTPCRHAYCVRHTTCPMQRIVSLGAPSEWRGQRTSCRVVKPVGSDVRVCSVNSLAVGLEACFCRSAPSRLGYMVGLFSAKSTSGNSLLLILLLIES